MRPIITAVLMATLALPVAAHADSWTATSAFATSDADAQVWLASGKKNKRWKADKHHRKFKGPQGHAYGYYRNRRNDDRWDDDHWRDHSHRYQRGERLTDYVIIRDPGLYGLDRRRTYARRGDYLYDIDPDTRKVINLIGAVAAFLN